MSEGKGIVFLGPVKNGSSIANSKRSLSLAARCGMANQHPEKAKEYANLKMKLQTQFKQDRDAYTEAKGEFILQCVKTMRFLAG